MNTSAISSNDRMETQWSVFSGGPSAGKTTIAKALEDVGYQVQYDVVRSYIESKLAEGNSLEVVRGEAVQFHRLIADLFEENESTICHTVPRILENGMPDVLSYLSLWVNEIPDDVYDRVIAYRRRYKHVFIFEPLATFEEDGVRIEDGNMAQTVFDNANKFYREAGYDPVVVPRFCNEKEASIAQRLHFISSHL